jgi:ribosomal protein S18 acetylase RimI-like enzyme
MKTKLSEITYEPYDEKINSEIMKFFYSLTDEQDYFTLNLEQLMASNYMVFLLNDKNEIVGLAGVRKSFMHSLYFMVVNKKFQGQGYGKKLISVILDNLPPKSLLLLSVGRSNINARRLYHTVGFKTLHRHKSNAYMLYNNKPGQWFRLFVKIAVFIKARL